MEKIVPIGAQEDLGIALRRFTGGSDSVLASAGRYRAKPQDTIVYPTI